MQRFPNQSKPDFKLPCSGGGEIRSPIWRGKAVVCIFIRVTDTRNRGCTKEAIGFFGYLQAFEDAGAVLSLGRFAAIRWQSTTILQPKHGPEPSRCWRISTTVAVTEALWRLVRRKTCMAKNPWGIERGDLSD